MQSACYELAVVHMANYEGKSYEVASYAVNFLCRQLLYVDR